MFVVYVGSIFTTLHRPRSRARRGRDAGHPAFVLAIAAWLWFTVLFANFAEAMAEGRGKAQAATLRAMRQHVHREAARRRATRDDVSDASRPARSSAAIACSSRRTTSFPPTAKSIEGVASVNESAVTGESAPGDPRGGRRLLARSPAARACCPTGSSCASRQPRGRRRSSIA